MLSFVCLNMCFHRFIEPLEGLFLLLAKAELHLLPSMQWDSSWTLLWPHLASLTASWSHKNFLGKKLCKESNSGNTWTFEFLSFLVENQMCQEAHSSDDSRSTANKILNPEKKKNKRMVFYWFSCCNCLSVESERILSCPTGACGNVGGWVKAASNITMHCSRGVEIRS